MAKPKYDYDGDDFYLSIHAFALQGMTNAEIADAMDLEPEVFSTMKNGKYAQWSAEDNANRSARINKVLARGRRKTLALVRGAYLKAAIGGKIVRNVSTKKRPVLDENGEPEYDVVVDPKTNKEKRTMRTVVAEISETEFEQPPNIQALSVWLHHHDPEWRRVDKGEPDPEDEANTTDNGLNIEAWIAKEGELSSLNNTEAPAE